MNDELKSKYGRIANDPSQLEMFKNDQIDINATLQAAIEGKIAFDGEITFIVSSGLNPTYYLDQASIDLIKSFEGDKIVKDTAGGLCLVHYQYGSYYILRIQSLYNEAGLTIFSFSSSVTPSTTLTKKIVDFSLFFDYSFSMESKTSGWTIRNFPEALKTAKKGICKVSMSFYSSNPAEGIALVQNAGNTLSIMIYYDTRFVYGEYNASENTFTERGYGSLASFLKTFTYPAGSPQWDTTPTPNSNKPVTSGGIYSAIEAVRGGTKLYSHMLKNTTSGYSLLVVTPIQNLLTAEGNWNYFYNRLLSVVFIPGGGYSNKSFYCGGIDVTDNKLVSISLYNVGTSQIDTYTLSSLTDTVTLL